RTQQALAVGAVVLYSVVATALVLLVVHVLVGLRVNEETEALGLDLGQHRERLAT
ncbi:MAG: ammonium transporter, partial [Variovorax sp.]